MIFLSVKHIIFSLISLLQRSCHTEPAQRTPYGKRNFKDKSKAKKFEPLDFIKMQHIVASILNVNVS